jgi:aminomethyltransferase
LNAVISRTGYTGEDGFELIVAANSAVDVWNALLESGRPHSILPCGLGARDTLRLEAAMPLHGHELSESINPFAAGVGWAVKLDKGQFVGRDALAILKGDPGPIRAGIKLETKRIARQGAALFSGDREIGVVTSGTFSPSLQVSLALARVEPAAASIGTILNVDIRGHHETAQVVQLPFYKRGRKSDTVG